MEFTLLESAPDAIVVADGRGTIIFINAHTADLFGYSRDELVGNALDMLIPERFRPRHVAHLNSFISAPRTRPMGAGGELYGRRKNGEEFPVEISLSPLADAGDVLIVSAIRDISDRKRSEAEHARLTEESAAHAETNRRKDEFLAILSHELRTPLNAILGWTAILRHGSLDARRTEHALATIERNARLQAQLMEDLLDVSRVIAGKLRLELVPVDLVEAAEAAVDVVTPSAAAKRIRVELFAEPRPILLLADADRLQQALWNLLTNAVKFTAEDGRIELRIRAEDTSATIVVRDTGKGIDSAFLPRVFDRFGQEDISTTRVYGGLGLGLAIVRAVVEAHGGTVEAFSPGLGRGSTFTIVLPLVSATERRRGRERAPHARTDALKDVRILVVDDNADERDLLAEILRPYGAIVAMADGVSTALSLLEGFRPAVIVSDVAMPEQDGHELMRQVRGHTDSSIANTPAVAVTAHARAEDRKRALAAGFNRYVSKPVDLAEFIDALAFLSLPQAGLGGAKAVP